MSDMEDLHKQAEKLTHKICMLIQDFCDKNGDKEFDDVVTVIGNIMGSSVLNVACSLLASPQSYVWAMGICVNASENTINTKHDGIKEIYDEETLH